MLKPVRVPLGHSDFVKKTTDIKIPDNVSEFLWKCGDVYGAIKNDEFSMTLWSDCCRIESPIEQLFFIAIHLVAAANIVDLEIAEQFADENDNLLIVQQWKVGKYRIDFALRRHPTDKIVCVELDGHEFHDRDERQRRYEKARDRHLTASGYSVLHFTGSEVAKDPCAVALEVFKLATGLDSVAIHPFEV